MPQYTESVRHVSGASTSTSRRVFRIVGVVLSCVLVASSLLAIVVYVNTSLRVHADWGHVTISAFEMPDEVTPEMIARGEDIAIFRGCADCHGAKYEGKVFIEQMPIFDVVTPNLTPGGVKVKDYTDEDWARAVRHGIGPDKRSLIFMPSYEWTEMSDEDLAAMVAFFRSLEPIEHEPPEQIAIGPMGRVLMFFGQIPMLPAEKVDHALRPASITPAVSVEYGRYLASGCVGCHGDGYSGGAIPGTPPDWPPASNITTHETGIAEWSKEDFYAIMRTGVNKEGREVNAMYMPWSAYKAAPDRDLDAMWLYLQSLPKKAYGGR